MTDPIEAIRSGGVIVIPTDTVYGLACLPAVPAAVARIFELKGRPDDKPLPVLAHGIGPLKDVAAFDDRAEELGRRFWPGPVTLVVPRAAGFTHDLGGHDSSSVAVRVPQNEVALELLRATGPLAVTSANRSGQRPVSTVGEAEAIFGSEVAAYVDGGLGGGDASTVISMIGEPRVLREGAIAGDQVLGTIRVR